MKSAAESLEQMILRAREFGSSAYDVGLLSDAIDEVFRVHGTEDIADLVRDLVRKDAISVEQGSNILRVAVWSGSENGRSLLQHLDQWLRTTTDPVEVQLAMNRDTYPFANADEMRRVLQRITKDFPEHAARCAEFIRTRPK